MPGTTLTALVLNCTLKPSPAPSSSGLMSEQFATALAEHGVATTTVRVVDHQVKHGVKKDMGEGDEWPGIRERIVAADISWSWPRPGWVTCRASATRCSNASTPSCPRPATTATP
jgi:hypothetical protein